MDEYGSFCYLDVQKTGSTFVSAFLGEHIAGERVRKQKHGRITKDYDRDKLYFISVREPLDHYLSLYFHGWRGRGALRRRLDAKGFGEMYGGRPEDFAAWLGFMLDPANAEQLGEGYEEAAPELYGYQTFRHLALAFHKPMAKLKVTRGRDALVELYRSQKIFTRTLRNERLNADLRDLVETDLRHAVKDLDAALAALPLERADPPEAIEAKAAAAALPQDLRARLEEREWFLYDVVGYPGLSAERGVALGAATP